MEGGNTSCVTQWHRTHFPNPDLSNRLLNKYHPLCHTAKQRQGQAEGPGQDLKAAQQITQSATYTDEKWPAPGVATEFLKTLDSRWLLYPQDGYPRQLRTAAMGYLVQLLLWWLLWRHPGYFRQSHIGDEPMHTLHCCNAFVSVTYLWPYPLNICNFKNLL